jgi:hypothetical protein
VSLSAATLGTPHTADMLRTSAASVSVLIFNSCVRK